MVGLSVVEVGNLRFLLCFADILVLLIVGGKARVKVMDRKPIAGLQQGSDLVWFTGLSLCE